MLVGLVGLYDPPRPEVADAVRQCREAGIKVTMVTGDYGLTAQAIARQIGLLEPPLHRSGSSGHQGDGADPVRVIDGADLARINDLQLRQLLKYRQRLVFARMAPEQKLRLVQAYRALGEVVAVTGDGVNDAPALRAADVGLAMGLSGTDVAREAADIVLIDDNFATIVQAVRYGRWKLHFPHRHRFTDDMPRAVGGRPAAYPTREIGLALFDLDADPGERHDVAALHPTVVAQLSGLAHSMRQRLGDSLTSTRGTENRPAGRTD